MSVLRSRDNARVRRWTRLARDARARRTERRTLLEGVHLVSAYLDQGGRPSALLVTETGLRQPDIAALVDRSGTVPVLVTDGVFHAVVEVESPTGLAAEIEIPGTEPDLAAAKCCVFLEGIQDAGNVGAILRSAAAFGVDAAVLGSGCADPWSPKALRAAQGGHFVLAIADRADLAAAFVRFGGPLACTVPRGGTALQELNLRGRIGWIFGSEGQGVSPELAAHAAFRATIPISGNAESLNVAAAAAVCLYERSRQLREPLNK
jgi:RNA methyltransferase, TrmH family